MTNTSLRKNIMDSDQIGPLVTAMATPFNKWGEVDTEQAIHLGDYLIENKTTCLLLAGTTGESPTLTHQEEYTLFEAFVKRYKGKVPVMAGTGSNCTRTAIQTTQKAEEIGIDCSLQVVPYYNKPSQDGIYEHFAAIANQTSLPIILYDIPGRTGRSLEPETLIELAKLPNIIGLKDASGSLSNFNDYYPEVKHNMAIYSGDDGLTASFLKEGAFGVVSVASHVCGIQLFEMIEAAKQQNWDKVAKLDASMKALFEVLFIAPNPAPLKFALSLIGFPSGRPRLPLVEVNESEAKKIEQVIDAYLDALE